MSLGVKNAIINLFQHKQNIQQTIMEETKVCKQFFEKYRIQTQIGRGASGVCYRVISTKGRSVYAMKKIHINSIKKNSTKQASSEVSILSKIDHPNIIKYYESFADESNLYIVMQYAQKGDLHNILKRRKIKRQFYSEAQIWEMSRQMLSALEYLHKNNIIHRDVKTLNIFVDQAGKLYLGDLGVSRIIKTDCGLYSRVGTPLYLPPEIIKYEKYDYKADVWGLGCVIYLLSTLSHPFQGKNIISLGQNIVFAQPKPIQNYSADLNQFIMEMLQKNPMKRATPTEFLKKYASFFQTNANLSLKVMTQDSKSHQITETGTKNQQKHAIAQIDNLKNQIIKNSDKNPFIELRHNQIKKKIVNNFIFEQVQKDFIFNESDKIKQENTSKSIKKFVFKEPSNKNYCNFQETIVLSKKNQVGDQQKKSAQITYKNQCVKNQIIQQIRQKSSDEFIQFVHQNKRQSIIGCRKGFTPQNKQKIIESVKPQFYKSNVIADKKQSIYFKKNQQSEIDELKPCFSSFVDINKIPTDNKITDQKRIRPKSSIINKERQESTLRVLKKSVKKIDHNEINKFVETQYLKSPQMVMF